MYASSMMHGNNAAALHTAAASAQEQQVHSTATTQQHYSSSECTGEAGAQQQQHSWRGADSSSSSSGSRKRAKNEYVGSPKHVHTEIVCMYRKCTTVAAALTSFGAAVTATAESSVPSFTSRKQLCMCAFACTVCKRSRRNARRGKNEHG